MAEPVLASLDPIGIGTAGCESLSGYVQRLAALHGTVPGQLVFRVLAWLDQGQSNRIGHWAARPRSLRIGSNINSFTQADAWVGALQQATGRCDLDYLATGAWDNLFPTRGFQTACHAWCPKCLASDAVPHNRLAWALQASRTCIIHKRPLQARCAVCGRQMPVLHDRSLVLKCPHCGGDLRRERGESAPPATAFDLWCAIEVGHLVSCASNWYRQLSWDPSRTLGSLARSRGLQDAAAFARFVGTSRITAWYWLQGKARPSLPFALLICYRFGVSLAAQIEGRLPPDPTDSGLAQSEFHLPRSRVIKRRDWAGIKKRLEAELSRPAETARALRQIARAEQIAVRTLRAHFPDFCLRLSEHNRKRLRSQSAQAEARLEMDITEALSGIVKMGEQPTPLKIESALHRPGLFDRRAPRRVLRRILKTPDGAQAFPRGSMNRD
jgi:hypothetical protein